MEMATTAGLSFISDSRFHSLTEDCGTYFSDRKSMQHLKKELHYKVLHSERAIVICIFRQI